MGGRVALELVFLHVEREEGAVGLKKKQRVGTSNSKNKETQP